MNSETTSLTKPSFSLCVYCGSRVGNRTEFAAMAHAVGTWIGRHDGQLVYGGGHNGLMGIMADAALAAGARVVGVIPKALVEKEWAHTGCTELHIVENMHERKRIMAEQADAFLALPGGIGTLEEFFEVWTWRQLGYHDKPVGLLNMDGFYDSLLTFLQSAVKTGFMTEWQMELIRTGNDVELLMKELVQAAGSTLPTVQLDQI
ncbi:MAG: TIGR00730 family Rossman fold protein [Polaromonas sp.]